MLLAVSWEESTNFKSPGFEERKYRGGKTKEETYFKDGMFEVYVKKILWKEISEPDCFDYLSCLNARVSVDGAISRCFVDFMTYIMQGIQ